MPAIEAIAEAVGTIVSSTFSFLETENEKDMLEQQWLNDSIPEYTFFLQPNAPPAEDEGGGQIIVIAMIVLVLMVIAFFFFYRKQ